jgi:succinate dehydrogenase/fumarate reductase flavoprotein subunit
LKTSEFAQVLDQNGEVIDGLYAVGTDMASIMGGYYPAGGINLGPALTFGYIAGRHLAGVTKFETDDRDADPASPGRACVSTNQKELNQRASSFARRRPAADKLTRACLSVTHPIIP